VAAPGPPSLECRRYQPLLASVADGAPTEAERAAVEAHLAGCEDCRRQLAALRAALAAAEEEPPAEPVDEHVRERLLALFRAWRRGQPGGRRPRHPR